MDEAKQGWNLWELDRHHGEEWKDRFQMTQKNPTLSMIFSKTPNGHWALFREKVQPMWEDKVNFGRFIATKFALCEIYETVPSFFKLLASDQHVNGLVLTRKKKLALWLNQCDKTTLNALKKKFSIVCSRKETEFKWEAFENSKKENLHLTKVVWKYGHISAETGAFTNSSVYALDIDKASPNFIINYKRMFPIKATECFLIETTFSSPFPSSIEMKKFVESCFEFQKQKTQSYKISKAVALRIVMNNITVRFYTDPIGYCKRESVEHKDFHEVLILFAHKLKEKLLNEFLSPEMDLKINGYREENRALQFTL